MKKLVFLFLIVLSTPSISADENMNLTYKISWAGMKAGEMKLVLKEDAGKYDYTASLQTQNLAKTLLKYWSVNTAKGFFSGTKYTPLEYVTNWKFKKEAREITLKYLEGKLVGESTEPVDNRGKFPLVPVEVKQNSVDPVVTGVLMRKKVAELMAQKVALPYEFIVETFDGRRKFDTHFNIKGIERVTVDGTDKQTLHVHAYRKPVAGFSNNELKRMDNDEDFAFDVYLDTKSYVPLLAVADTSWGEAEFTLAK